MATVRRTLGPAEGPARPSLGVLGRGSAAHLNVVRPAVGVGVEQRVTAALRCLWSLASDAEGKEIVEALARDYKSSQTIRKASDGVMNKIHAAQMQLKLLMAVPRGKRDLELLGHAERLLDEAIGECAK